MKYNQLYEDVYSIFGSTAWKNELITTYPEGYGGKAIDSRFIRLKIVSGSYYYSVLASVSGQLIIDIFTPASKGMKDAITIADTLDSYLVGKKVNTTQFGQSTLTSSGNDAVNASLLRCEYSISFNHFGK